MKEWTIPVNWGMSALVKVKAETLEEAIAYAKEEGNDIPLPQDGAYVDGSWCVLDSKEDISNLYNDEVK